MAFVGMEDLQGTIELVIFPRTWERVAPDVQIDRIVMVDGKVDAASGDPKVLVDHLTTEFSKTVGVPSEPETPRSNLRSGRRGSQAQPGRIARPAKDESQAGDGWPDASEEIGVPWDMDDGAPPPPDEPPDWDSLSRDPISQMPAKIETPEAIPTEEPVEVEWGSAVPAGSAGLAEPVTSLPTSPGVLISEIVDTAVKAPEPAVQPILSPALEVVAKPPVVNPPTRRPAGGERTSGLPAYLVSPLQDVDEDGEVRMLTVVLRASGDKTRDVLRLRRIHGMMLTYPGIDRFAVQVFERGRSYLLEFPNSSTHICQELLDRLYALVGVENTRIDPITFH
jgi:DNA polymerase-3 subunit alpha